MRVLISAETFLPSVDGVTNSVPVVAPASGGPVDLVDHGRDGWLWPTEYPGLLRFAFESLLLDPDRCRAMGREARRSVAHRSWAAVGDQLLAVYAEVAGIGAVPDRRRRWAA